MLGLTLRRPKLIMYCDTVTESEGFPLKCPGRKESSIHGCVPCPWSRPYLWLIAARIFWAVAYVTRTMLSSFALPV